MKQSSLFQSLQSKDTLLLGIGIYAWTFIAGGLSDVIDVDAAQYASISMEMTEHASFFEVTERGKDYLDKPPLLFWLSSLSFFLFGYSNFAYKLPSLLFSLLTLYYTYQLAIYHYNRKTARLSVFFLASSIGFIWINNDVKTDALITSCFTFSIYYLSLYIDAQKLKHLFFASLGMGMGMLSKGPMGLIFPMVVILIYIFQKGEISQQIRIQWLLLPFVVAIVLLPMCIGLYYQFDLHPEKIVNGKTGVSGLRFYFWEQSFGRITGENKWKNDTSFLYLFHSFLILIFPFSLLSIEAYVSKIKDALRFKKFDSGFYLLAGSVLVLSLLSFSSYKIPHYASLIFPLGAIVLASSWSETKSPKLEKWLRIHHLILGVLVFPILLVSFLLLPGRFIALELMILMLLMGAFIYSYLQKYRLEPLYILALSFAFVFNTHLLPGFQYYSEGRRFANLIEEAGIKNEEIYFLNRNSRALEFYLQRRIAEISWEDLYKKQNAAEPAWYYMSLDGKESLLYSAYEIEEELILDIYDMNRLKLGFFDPRSREKYLQQRFLIKLKVGKTK